MISSLKPFLITLLLLSALIRPTLLLASSGPTPTVKACHVCEEEETSAPVTPALPVTTPAESETTPALGSPMLSGQFQAIAGDEAPVVRAVMFWMDTCPHCHYVLDEVLPPLQQKYGAQLDILLVEVKSEREWNWLVQTGTAFGLREDRLGVPFLVIGDTVLMGSEQIPTFLPALIEQHLAAGGVDYPQVAGLAEVLPPPALTDPTVCAPATPCGEETPQVADTATPVPAAPAIAEVPTIAEAPAAAVPASAAPAAPPVSAPPTPSGFELAIAIMSGMVLALVYSGAVVARGFTNVSSSRAPARLDLAIPLLTVAGMGVAGYLAYVETQAVAAVCGPVGDCNAVQSSPYATLFGILPVGVLGLIGYVAILAAWLWGQFGSGWLAGYAPLATFGLSMVGVLFSLYLTYLEPFVIRAVCIWCLTSAVIITLLMLLSLGPLLQTRRVIAEGSDVYAGQANG